MGKNGAVLQPLTYRTADLVALEFQTDEDHRRALLIYVQGQPNTYFATPGRNNIIIPREKLNWFEHELARAAISFSKNRVGSMSELTPAQAAAVRRQARAIPDGEPKTAAEIKAEIARLKARLSAS